MIPGSDHHILSLPPDPGGEAGARTPWGADCPSRAVPSRAVPSRAGQAPPGGELLPGGGGEDREMGLGVQPGVAAPHPLPSACAALPHRAEKWPHEAH